MTAPVSRRYSVAAKKRQAVLAGMYQDVPGQNADGTAVTYTVATLPAANVNAGRLLYCSNGAAGQPALVFSNGTNWKVLALGANASAT